MTKTESGFRKALKEDSRKGVLLRTITGFAFILEYAGIVAVSAIACWLLAAHLDAIGAIIPGSRLGFFALTTILAVPAIMIAVILMFWLLGLIVIFFKACEKIAGGNPKFITLKMRSAGAYMLFAWPRSTYAEYVQKERTTSTFR
jgi:hypothetical protein